MGTEDGGKRGSAVSEQESKAEAEAGTLLQPALPDVPQQVSGIPPALQHSGMSRKPRVLLAASGSVAAIKFPIIVQSVSEWAQVRAVCTSSALHFVEPSSLPVDVPLYTDDDEWRKWSRLGDTVLHIELRKWADVLVIAPLSANTLAKLAAGVCDNLLTCIVRAWDFQKPLLVAPAMNTHMWTSPFTARHLGVLEDLGASAIQPISKTLACGDVGTGAMAEPASIEGDIRRAVSALDLRSAPIARTVSPRD